MPFTPSTRTGEVQPYSTMLAAIFATCSSLWVRGLQAAGITSFSRDRQLLRYSPGRVCPLAAEHNNNVDICHPATNLLLPIANQMLFDGCVCEVEWTVGVLCLTGKHNLCAFVVIVVEANERTLFCHLVFLSE